MRKRTAPAATPPAPKERPQGERPPGGGSYIRMKNGSLLRALPEPEGEEPAVQGVMPPSDPATDPATESQEA